MIRTEQALAEDEANRPARTFRGSLGPLPHHRHRGQENYPGPATRNANARLGAPRCIPLNPASAKVAVMPDAPPSDPQKKRTKFIHEYKSIFVHKKGHYGEHSSRPRRWSRPLLCPPSPPSFETRRYLTLFHCSSNQTPIKPVDLYGIILLAKLYLFSPPTN